MRLKIIMYNNIIYVEIIAVQTKVLAPHTVTVECLIIDPPRNSPPTIVQQTTVVCTLYTQVSGVAGTIGGWPAGWPSWLATRPLHSSDCTSAISRERSGARLIITSRVPIPKKQFGLAMR